MQTHADDAQEADPTEVPSSGTSGTLRAEDVGAVLADAIAIDDDDGSQHRRLVDALSAPVSSIVKDTVQRDPKTFSDAILPGLGPAIRKAVSDGFKGMIEQINRSMDYSLSREGIAWRLEAARTGKSFAEIVMFHTLVYRVEQVFLIHGETGLLLQHVAADPEETQNADMISSMLTAIQDFARDSFNSAEGDHLETVQLGSLTVWIHRGPNASIATVIRGHAPQQLRETITNTTERIHTEYAEELAGFEGDTDAFRHTTTLLEECVSEAQRRPKKSLPFVIAILLLLCAGAGWFIYKHVEDRMRWSGYFDSLSDEPGIVVSEVYRRGDNYRLRGLRDPLAPDPSHTLEEAGLDPQRIQFKWEPYDTLLPEYVLQRAIDVLAPPPTVKLRLEGTALIAKGEAPREWIRGARTIARALPGITVFTENGLLDLDASDYDVLLWKKKEKAFAEAEAFIEGSTVLFDAGNDSLTGTALPAIPKLRDEIVRLAEAGRILDKDVSIVVTGHGERDADGMRTAEPGKRRAAAVVRALLNEGVPRELLKFRARDMVNLVGEQRPVTLEVIDRRVQRQQRASRQ